MKVEGEGVDGWHRRDENRKSRRAEGSGRSHTCFDEFVDIDFFCFEIGLICDSLRGCLMLRNKIYEDAQNKCKKQELSSATKLYSYLVT